MALPPFAKIDNLLKTRLRVRELALVNDETGVRTPGFYLVENLIERHNDMVEFAGKKLQRKKSARHPARDSDFFAV